MDKKNGPWTIKNHEKKFENDFFTVFEDDVIRPDGSDGEYATIRFSPGVAVLPIDNDGTIYLTSQFRYALGRQNIEAICGAVDHEDLLDAANVKQKKNWESRPRIGFQ